MKIYKYTNNINGKIYIGITTRTLGNRHKEHIKNINDGLYFHNALLKYGIENFTLEIIDKAINIKELKNKEIYWIKKFNSFAYQKNSNGYNCTLGGDGGFGLKGRLNSQFGITPKERMDKHTFRQWKANLKKSAKRGEEHEQYGKHPIDIFGEEGFKIACDKSKERFINNNPSKYRNYWGENNPNAKKVIQMSRDGEYIATYNTIKEASKIVNIGIGHIGSCCTGKRKTTGGFKWAYYDEYIKQTSIL